MEMKTMAMARVALFIAFHYSSLNNTKNARGSIDAT
jgi:hypothetical protein